jgi:hypothetical protein
MKSHLTCYCILFVFTVQLSAQQRHGTGLRFDDTAHRRVKTLPTYSGAKYTNLPLKTSLRMHCPVPGEQGVTNTCVGWAAGYGALTICRAINGNRTDNDSIERIANSALYVYNKIKPQNSVDCNDGATLPNALEMLKSEGDCLEVNFKNDVANCNTQPNAQLNKEASLFKIKDYASVFDIDDSEESRIQKTCELLAAKNPVLIGIELTPSFFNIQDGQKQWTPSKEDRMMNSGHAMVVVGYDLRFKTFEVMNSWGSRWGDKGFINISFDAFRRFVKYGYMILNDDKTLKAGMPSKTPQTVSDLTGEFVFRYPTGTVSGLNGGDSTIFEEAKVKYNPIEKRYETIRKDWKVGESVFQLLARNVPKGQYIYIFSVDGLGKLTTHYPLSTNDFVNFMPSPNAEIVLPSLEDALMLSTKGADNLCILFTDKAISDFDKRLMQLEKTGGQFKDKLKTAFGDVLIDDNLIQYERTQMVFKSPLNSEKKRVVPIVLTVEGL